MNILFSLGTAGAMLLLAACTTAWDMHGNNPQEYYSQHPVKNQVEMRHMTHTLPLSMNRDEAAADLEAALADMSQAAVESVQIRLHPSQMKNEAKKSMLSRLFTGRGFPKRAVTFQSSPEVKSSEAEIHIAYAAVLSPRCPDWRASPITTYSNTPMSNFGCASVTNLGLQVADPRDLVKGRGDTTPDTERNLRVIREYRGGDEEGGSGDSGSSSGAGSAADAMGLGAPAAPQ